MFLETYGVFYKLNNWLYLLYSERIHLISHNVFILREGGIYTDQYIHACIMFKAQVVQHRGEIFVLGNLT